MNNVLKHNKLCLWLCLAAASLLTSCSSDNEQADDELQSIKIMFTITMGDKPITTRTDTWGDNDYTEETATEWESYISPGTLQVFVYNKNNTYIDKVNINSFSRHSNEKNVYDIIGSFSAKISDSELEDGKLPCKLVVFANCSKYMTEKKAAAGINSLSSIAYNFDAAGMKTGTTYIPMWGVRTYSSDNASAEYQPLTIEKNTQTNAGTIYVLRSMAKVRVTLSDDMADNYTLSNVSLSNYSYYGYLTPASCDVSDTEKLSHEIVTNEEALTAGTAFQTFNPYSGSNARLNLSFIEETTGKSFIIYVPEFATTMTNGDTDPYINLTLTNKTTNSPQTYIIPVTNADNEPQSLVRNTVYTYKITGSGCTLEYQAQEWTVKTPDEIIFK